MDLAALEYTRSHYDKHSNQVSIYFLHDRGRSGPRPHCSHPAHGSARPRFPQYATTEEALKARAQGPGAPLKKFHNEIKRQLINRCGPQEAGAVGLPAAAAPLAAGSCRTTRCTARSPLAVCSLSGALMPSRSCLTAAGWTWRQFACASACHTSGPPIHLPVALLPPLWYHHRFASGADSLLDFCCGRGGDIWKWIDAGITRVKGIDLSPGEIQEARARWVLAAGCCVLAAACCVLGAGRLRICVSAGWWFRRGFVGTGGGLKCSSAAEILLP